MIAEELRVLVRAETQQAVRGLNQVQNSTKGADQGFKRIIKTMGAKAAAFAAVALSMRSVVNLAKESIDLARRQVQSETQLAAAIKASGNAVGGTMASYQAFASEIQELTVIGDEAVLEMLALAEAFGVSGEQAEDMTKQAIGLSQAFGVNANTAMRMLSNAVEGNFTQLQRYIPELRTAGTEAEKMAVIQERAAAGFEMAEAAAQTSFGAIDQYKNAAGDLKEQLGITIADAIEPFARSMTNTLGVLTENIRQSREWSRVLDEWESGSIDGADAADALAEAQNALTLTEEKYESAIRQRAAAQERANETYSHDDYPAETMLALAERRVDAAMREQSVARQAVASLERQAAAHEHNALMQDAQATAAEQLAAAERLADAEREERIAKQEGFAASFETTMDQIAQQYEHGLISEEQFLVGQRGARMQFINDLLDMGFAIDDLRGNHVDAIHALDEQLAALRGGTQETAGDISLVGTAYNALIDDMERAGDVDPWRLAQDRLAELRKEADRTRDAFDDMTEGSIARIQRMAKEFEAAGVDSADVAQWAAMEMAEHYVQAAGMAFNAFSGMFGEIQALSRQSADRQIADLRRVMDEAKDRHDAEIEWAEATGATAEEIADMKIDHAQEAARMEEELEEKEKEIRRKQFAMDKAMRIGQATMAGAQAVVQSLTVDPTGILAGFVGAMSAAQIGLITAQQPPAFERGGSFITSGPQMIQVGDGQSPRERVTVEPLSGPYASGGSGGGGINITINGVIGDRERVADWVREGIRRGQQRGAIRA